VDAVKAAVDAELGAARRRSLALLEPLDEHALTSQHSPLMSPLVWDLAHVGNYEEQWLLRAIGATGVRPELDDIYDAFRHPRRSRTSLPLLGPGAARHYVATVRDRVLDHLDRIELEGAVALLDNGFVYGMVVQHEHQHAETMLATLQLMTPGYRPDAVAPPAPDGATTAALPAEVLVPGGELPMGTSRDPWAYDNERPVHMVDLPPYWIDTMPVTNAAYLAFMTDGGYDDERLWDAPGWAWRQEAELEHPHAWARDGAGGWVVDRLGDVAPLVPDEPVQHVCWHEARAWARWAGRRLPTEAEWERAASWSPDGRPRRFPWGDERPDARRANVGQRHFGPARVGAYPAGASALGVHHLIGDVWEWTASDFSAYPGFASFPYREYSEVFYGTDYKVLRGGSWATDPSAIRATFRNWDYPIRRQIFAGFRTARDVEGSAR
jgi:gamma-glutamyl hercynylcysteine S-oxide synthase